MKTEAQKQMQEDRAQHLINAPDRASITNWYNSNTKNSGTIKTNTFLKDQLNVELGKA